MDQHLATIWEAISDAMPDDIALEHGGQVTSWRDFEQRAARFAGAMLAAGVRPGDTVAIDLYNGSEYLEVFFAALKIRAVPANVNYRYLDEELRQLLALLDAAVLVYPAPLRDQVAGAVAATSGLRLTVEVGAAAASAPGGVHAYEDLIAAHEPAERVQRSPRTRSCPARGARPGCRRQSSTSSPAASRTPGSSAGRCSAWTTSTGTAPRSTAHWSSTVVACRP